MAKAAAMSTSDPKRTSLSLDALVTAFRREAGFVEGQNVAVEYCRADNLKNLNPHVMVMRAADYLARKILPTR